MGKLLLGKIVIINGKRKRKKKPERPIRSIIKIIIVAIIDINFQSKSREIMKMAPPRPVRIAPRIFPIARGTLAGIIWENRRIVNADISTIRATNLLAEAAR